MNWIWMNIPLCALFFLAWTFIPLRMINKHPDTGPGRARPDRGLMQPEPSSRLTSEPSAPARELTRQG